MGGERVGTVEQGVGGEIVTCSVIASGAKQSGLSRWKDFWIASPRSQ
jgi:hypothetical protein